MSNICAGVGLGQMKILNENVVRRRENHSFYKEIFKQIEGVEHFEVLNKDYFSSYWLNTILINCESPHKNRESLRFEQEAKNIESRPLWKPMHLQPFFENYPYYGGKISGELFEKGLCLPSGSNLTEKHKSRIKEVVINFFK